MDRDKVAGGFRSLKKFGTGWSAGAALWIALYLPLKYFVTIFGGYALVLIVVAIITAVSPFAVLYVFLHMTWTTWEEIIKGYFKARGEE